MLPQTIEFHFLWLNNISLSVYIPHFLYSFIYGYIPTLFYILAIVSNVAISMQMSVSLWHVNFNSFILYTWHWDCWIIWWVYKKPPYCFQKWLCELHTHLEGMKTLLPFTPNSICSHLPFDSSHQAKKVLYSKGNDQQIEKATNRIGENLCTLHTNRGLIARIYKELQKLSDSKETTAF